MFSKANTQKFNDTTDQYAFPSTLITNNYIDVSTIAFLYDNYCIVDSSDNLYIAVNQRNLDGTKSTVSKVYFNFVDRRTTADLPSDYVVVYENKSNISIAVGIGASGVKQENYFDESEIELITSIAITASGALQFNSVIHERLEPKQQLVQAVICYLIQYHQK